MRHRLPYPAIAIALTLFAPGFVILLYLLSWGWAITAPPFSYDYRIEFTWYRYWTPLASVLIGASVVFASGYVMLWFRKPKWNLHFVTAFSWFSVLFGIGFSIWILVFAFVIPTGFYSSGGPSGGGSGHTHDSPFLLVISLPILGAGIFGQRITSWIKKNPSRADPSDVRVYPNHLSKVGWISSSLAIIVVLGVVFGVLLNPAVSPMSYIHDRDGDGVADRFDHFPEDPNLWEPFGFWIKVTESADAFNLTIRETYTDNQLPNIDFYVSASHKNGAVVLDRQQLSEMQPDVGYSGVRFYDVNEPGFIGDGDVFEFDRTVYEEKSVFLLSDSRGEVRYLEFPLQHTS